MTTVMGIMVSTESQKTQGPASRKQGQLYPEMDYETGRYLYDRRVQDDPKQYRLYNYKDYSTISTRPNIFESKTVVPWSTWSSEGPLKVRLSHPPSGAFV